MTKILWRFLRNNQRLVLAILALVSGFGFIYFGHSSIGSWIIATIAIFCILPMIWEINQSFRVGKFNIDIVTVLSTVFAIVLKAHILALAIVLASLIRTVILAAARRRAGTSLQIVSEGAPKIAHLLRGRKEIDVPVSEIHTSARIVVKAGEIVPVDGVDEHNNHVQSGFISGHDLILRVAADAEHSQLQRIVRIARGALHSDSPFVRLTERFLPFFILLSLALSSAIWYISGEPRRALAVLAVATPSFLVTGAPLALLAGLGNLADKDVFIKSGTILERLSHARTLISGISTKLRIKGVEVLKAAGKPGSAARIRQIEDMQKRPVAYIANQTADVPVLTSADIAISVGANNQAIETANVIIASDSANLVGKTIASSKRTMAIATWSLLVGFVISLGLQLYFAVDLTNPIYGVAVLLLSDVMTICIALLAGRESK